MFVHCSLEASQIKHNLVGSIEHRVHQVFFEVPEPWKKVYSLSEHFPPKLLNVLQIFAKTFPNTSVSVFAPDSEYSSSRGSRLIYQRSDQKYEYVIPSEDIAETFHQIIFAEDPRQIKNSRFFETSSSQRDVFICTHANRDQCCGKFGTELYEKLRKVVSFEKDKIRIFRSSHIGGHRYSPTMLELPSLNCWGHLDEASALKIILRSGDTKSVLEHFRGSAFLSSAYFQVAEKEMLRLLGWDWFQCKDKFFAEENGSVFVSFTDSIKKTYKMEVTKAEPVLLRANCDEDKISSFPQYLVSSSQTD
jgi:hypothetical protein